MKTFKKFIKPYRHTLALFSAILFCLGLAMLHIIPPAAAGLLVGCWQLLQIAMSRKRTSALFISGLSEEQVKEFDKICDDIKALFPGMKELQQTEGGFAAIRKLPELLAAEKLRVDEVEKQVKKLRKHMAEGQHNTGVKWIGNVPFVTDDCARSIASVVALQCAAMGHEKMLCLNKDKNKHQRLLELSREYLGMEQKAGGALTPGDIPLPVIYMPQIIELVFAYGQARQYATVFPLGAGMVKLPRLQAGEDDFGFTGVGVGGQSQQIGQKEVAAALVTFTANKCGGIVRIPTELEEDTFVALGQFLARYIARQFAKLEDKTLFLADGSAAYAAITGIASYCVQNPAYLHKPAPGNTVVTDLTIGDFRALRALVNPAVIANMAANGQVQAAYYLHPTLEALLVTFNTLGQPLIYRPASNGQPATLDGFPIRWIGVSAPYSLNAQPSSFPAFFGDLSFWYLGERGSPRVEISKEVFFTTDELALRALERIDVEGMAMDAMATMQLPAA